MKIYEPELEIKDLIQNNQTNSVSVFIEKSSANTSEMIGKCEGEACSCDFVKKAIAQNKSSDVMPFSSILVTDVWNANDDVFCSEEIIKARNTPIHKPINWMHRGSEDTKNENIGVMVNSRLVKGGLDSLKYFTDSDIENFTVAQSSDTISAQTHIRQDGLIWAQYFPSYAKKIDSGIKEGSLYVSMECFFNDFDYVLKDDEDSENHIVLKRNAANAHLTKSLKGYGGKGVTNYKGQQYRIGRMLRDITFSGQGIVKEPANIKDGKILSIIINDEKSFSSAQMNAPQDPGSRVQGPSAPSIDPTMTTDPMSPEGKDSRPQEDPNELPKTYIDPKQYLYNTSEEAKYVAENELGCTGYHVYLENRHSENPFLYAALLGDPTDIEKQSMRPKFLPCSDHKEFLLLSGLKGNVGGGGGGGGRRNRCSSSADVCLSIDGSNLNFTTKRDIGSFIINHNGCITGATGGEAQGNAFVITLTETSLRANAPSGTKIDENTKGTLLVLQGEVTQSCLSGLSFSSPDGSELRVEFSQGDTTPTGGGNEPGPEVDDGKGEPVVQPRKMARVQQPKYMTGAAWEQLKTNISNRNGSELNDKKQYGYNNIDIPEGKPMTENTQTVDYQKKYEEAEAEIARLKKIEANKKISSLEATIASLESDIEQATEAIDQSAEVIGEMQAMSAELNELRDFVAETDDLISQLEVEKIGASRLEALNELVGDTYSQDDIPTLAEMSEEAYSHLYDSMDKVVSKIEEAAASIEAEAQVENDMNDAEQARILQAIEAVDAHSPSRQGDLVVKAARNDGLSAARNLISNALRR